MIKVILRRVACDDEVVFLPQVPQKGERIARSDSREASAYYVTGVTWIIPYEGLTPSELDCAIVTIST